MSEEQKRVSVVFSVKNDQFNKSLSETKKQIQITASEMQVAGQKVNLYGKNLQTLGNMQKTLQTQITNVTQKMKLYEESIAKNTTKVEENKKKLEELKNKKKDLTEQYKASVKATGEDSEASLKLKNSLEKCKSEYQETNNQIKNGVKAINNHTIEANKSEAELIKLQQQLKECDKAIAENSNHFIQASKKFESAGKTLEKVGVNVSAIGTKLMALGAPFVAFAGYATKTAASFEQDMANLQATSGATGKDFEDLTNKAKELGENTCKSASDSAQAMQYLALAGYDVNQILSSTEPILKASVAWGADMATSADLATDSMSALGISTDQLTHYLDVCSQAQRSSNTTATMMMEAYINCGGSLKNLNVPLEESATLIGILANQGLKGSDAGNSLNSILINLTGATSSARSAFKELGISAWDQNGKFIGLENTLIQLSDKLKGCTQEQRNNYLAMIGGKTQIDTLNKLLAGCGDQYVDLSRKIGQANGATEEMYSIMNDTAQGKIAAFKSKLEAVGIQVGDKLLPHINKLLDKLMELLDWFGNLDESTQDFIVKMGLMTFATGGLLKGVGKVTTSLGSLSKTFGGILGNIGKATAATSATTEAFGVLGASAGTVTGSLGGLTSGLGAVAIGTGALVTVVGAVAAGLYMAYEHNEYMNTSLAATEEKLPLVQKAFNSLDGGIVKTQEEMEKLGLKHHEWTDKVAPETQKSIDDTATALQNLNLEIDRIKSNNISFDSGIVTNLQSQTNNICDTIVNQIKAKQSEATKSLSEYFNVDQSLDTYEQNILSFFDRNSAEQIQKVTECKNRINEIYQKAADEHRNLKEAEYAAIDKLEQDMADAQSRALASNQEEQTELLANFNVKMRTMDLEDTSKLMQEKAQKRDEDISNISEYYDTKIEMLQMNMNNMNETQRIAAQEEIRKMQNEKEQKLGIVNDTYNKYLNTLKEKYPEIYDQIDTATGEILTVEQKKDRQRVEQAISTYGDLSRITESGMKHIYNTQTQAYEDVYFMVDEKNGQIIGTWNMTTQEITGNSQDIRKQLQLIAQEHSGLAGSAKTDMENMVRSNESYSNSTRNTALNVISMLQGTGHEVNGLYTEVINCNGTPVQVQVNKDGTIANLNEIEAKLNETTQNRWMTVWVQYKNADTGETWHGYSGASYGYGYDANGNPIQHNALGTANAIEGLSYVNEEGPELFDSVTSAARSIANEMAYLPAHTRVTNALMTTAKMKSNIQEEVNRQLTSKLIRSLSVLPGSNGSTDIILGNVANILKEQTNVIKNKKTDVYMDSNKVTNTVDRISGSRGQMERRLNGWDR